MQWCRGHYHDLNAQEPKALGHLSPSSALDTSV